MSAIAMYQSHVSQLQIRIAFILLQRHAHLRSHNAMTDYDRHEADTTTSASFIFHKTHAHTCIHFDNAREHIVPLFTCIVFF